MTMPLATALENRSVIRISGTDCRSFLQGLVSNDVLRVKHQKGVYAALLTPQGKFLHDMFILEHEGALLIDCEAERAVDLLRRLNGYKLRAVVTLENARDVYSVWAVWGGDYTAPLCFADPRLAQLGHRAFVANGTTIADAQIAPFDAYDAHRLALGVADGSRDLEIEKSTLAEGNFDFLNGIDWKKGCYVGQELTARMHYRGLVKKRLFPVRIKGAVDAGTPLIFEDAEAGMLRSHNQTVGLALLTIEAAQTSVRHSKPMLYGASEITPIIPSWMPN